MVGASAVILIVLSLTSTLGLLPDAWEDSLWRRGVPAAESVAPAVSLPKQPVRQSLRGFALGAKGAIAVDIDSGTVLFSKNAGAGRPIASIVKLATASVIIKNHSLSETVTIGSLPSYPVGAVKLGLQPGQKITVGQLLTAALIPSANDAADALAIYDSGSVAAFVAKLNRLASEWEIGGIIFADANGLNQDSQASPAALAKLAELALTNPDIRKLVDMPTAIVQDLTGRSYSVTSTNKLLSDPMYAGIKTGYTEEAGQGVVALADLDGHRVITVVLGSTDRFGETRELVSYVKSAWSWQ